MPTDARERLLRGAEELFYAEGIQAVGVERLLAVTGVGRASFYRHFAGKDELVHAVLKRRDAHWYAWLEQAVAAHGGGPLAVFDALAESAESETFRGCAFINAMAEAADPRGEIVRLANEHKGRVTAFLDRLIEAAGHPEHRALAEQFVLLMDGATVTAMRSPGGAAARRARGIAERLLAGTGGVGGAT
ncbi:TetR/AcrR family transcriptional regulator [Kitasatospora sp. NBC_01287]|uniref:TetR/AcrR family transcriptional regulator n=1 Tax=Kitasatospora sp. NBC_01287 TaxID=2903573 RepID=UPI002251D393|nr:TetR/AcrR family transcriptional regulator [Kitasatospora sp. NBC_01287]MCX4746686.1 TetR/AcrR family transcriptional regulator [Kitasatospora sp. NBC_01287]